MDKLQKHDNCKGCAALTTGGDFNTPPTCAMKRYIRASYHAAWGWREIRPEEGIRCLKPTTEKQLDKFMRKIGASK